jgi:protein-disulfide isomerase
VTPLTPPNLAENDAALSKLLLPIQPEDHIHGVPEARYALVEYGDYECLACGQLFLVIRELYNRLHDDICLVFRHYPRSGSHPHAQQAAEAAEAAGVQNRFWEMHDLLFQHQTALATKDLYRYADQLALDGKRFRGELGDRTYEDRVREDFRRGVANGVYGTPALFINGVRHDGESDLESLVVKLKL